MGWGERKERGCEVRRGRLKVRVNCGGWLTLALLRQVSPANREERRKGEKSDLCGGWRGSGTVSCSRCGLSPPTDTEKHWPLSNPQAVSVEVRLGIAWRAFEHFIPKGNILALGREYYRYIYDGIQPGFTKSVGGGGRVVEQRGGSRHPNHRKVLSHALKLGGRRSHAEESEQ